MTQLSDPYTLVLTHDIDVLSVVSLPLGRTLVGFFYRCTAGSLVRLLQGSISLEQYFESVRAALEYLPAKLGLGLDAWANSLATMLSVERAYGVRSTLFFIPIYREPGARPEDARPAPGNRAAHYRLGDQKELLQQMVRDGWEVGVHGINAWRSLEDALSEFRTFSAICPQQHRVGIRMHWLYQRAEMWKHLDEAGYFYDATFGSNDRIGFPEGKYTPFKADGAKNLMVLPLNIQDCALFGSSAGGKTEGEAWEEVEKLLHKARLNHAVVTILWHNHSFVAPRFWGEIYERAIRQAKADGAAILTAGEAVARYRGDVGYEGR
jgi:peptidoglycan/xylan/chitin deacetylase (PgdA/CDA1 family)